MFLSLAFWIPAGLCLAFAFLYAYTKKLLRSRLSEIHELKRNFFRMSAKLTKAEARISEMQSRKGESISAIAHEIRTPLTCLIGYTQMMMENEFPREQQVAYLAIIVRESQRLNSLLADFLDIQFLEATNKVTLLPGHMEEFLRESYELFRNQQGSHRFVLDVAGSLPKVSLDARRVRQVLSNLMSNAVKYSPGGGTIRISAFAREKHVVACIQDQGIGIPADALPKLFTKFFRVHSEHTGDIPGTGLGLALVRECVRAQGGDVWVKSTVGQGSAFYFSLAISPGQGGAGVGNQKGSVPLSVST